MRSHVTPGLVGLGVLFYGALADDVGGGFVVFGAFFAGFRRLGDASGARGVIRTESTSEPSHFRQSAILASEGCSGGGKTPKDALNPFNSRDPLVNSATTSEVLALVCATRVA